MKAWGVVKTIECIKNWCNATQPNVIQCNDSQHINKNFSNETKMTLSIIIFCTKHNTIQYDDSQHNNKNTHKKTTLSITIFSTHPISMMTVRITIINSVLR